MHTSKYLCVVSNNGSHYLVTCLIAGCGCFCYDDVLIYIHTFCIMISSSSGNNSELNLLSVETIEAIDFGKFGSGKPCILGIDEAGRGPVLGPMVYGCAVVLADKLEELKQLGVDDSKALSETKRNEILEKMQKSEFVTYSLQVVHPRFISIQMNKRHRCSLNDISHNCAIELIRKAMQDGINVSEVFVDLVGQKEEIYQSFLLSHFPTLKITVSKRADSIYPIVGAASIAAKVTRDSRIKKWIFEEKGFEASAEGIGSGYPNDPLTKQFISKRIDPVFGYPSLVRFSWKTVEKIMETKAVKCEWNESATSASNAPKQTKLTDFFRTPKNATIEKRLEEPPKKRIRRHVFFTERGLTNLHQLD